MKGKKITLRKQFLIKVLSILFIIAIISGVAQLYYMKEQIVKQSHIQATAVANTMIRGLEQTDLATSTIENQIDSKLVSYASHIGTLLKGKKATEIKQDELNRIKKKLGLAGISILKETPDDFVAIQSTQKAEIGFSFKEYGYFEVGKLLMSGKLPKVPGATYTNPYTLVLPIAKSASHTDQSKFFKYAYYYEEGTDFIINPFIEANEVNHYMENVGPETEIKKLVKDSEFVEEIGVLNPKVIANPSLEKQIYPPLKKIEAGNFKFATEKDTQMLTQSNLKTQTLIETVKDKKLYKMFIPLNENRVIYIALDYNKMSGPLYRYSIILIISGLASLVVLFLLTARFFNRIYENIQKIEKQIASLKEGDLTVKSEIKDGSELEVLSKSTNRMVDKLNKLITDTQEQANKTQRLSVMLESEASNSVEKMYTLSTESTIKSREQLNEIMNFLDEIGTFMKNAPQQENVEEILGKVDALKKIAKDKTAATTDMTITLSDLIQSLHEQASELSDISRSLLDYMGKFKLQGGETGDRITD
ncbi:methyl-accepting chemotaxis protein [Bacillus sp. FSL W8-0183]|uniref:methyl-accepting chemotaxis protein n=1 Tax=Bacillus sp. FSL W8-0183 TaxID=2954568 RepID=UPI0030F5FA4E